MTSFFHWSMNLLVPLDPIMSSRKSGFSCTTRSTKEAKMATNFGLKFVHNSIQQIRKSWYYLELAHTVFNSDICINSGNIGIHLHVRVHFKIFRTTRRVGVFLLYHTSYPSLKNKKWNFLVSISTTWYIMQYHMVMDHVVFYVIHPQHAQVQYNQLEHRFFCLNY